MKVLLHGATNKTNFGDYLFADIFYNFLKDKYDVSFYECPIFGIGKFYKKNLKYTKKGNFISQFNNDALVYISGGYFGEKSNRFVKSFIRFVRYFLVGLIFCLKNKPIFIVGVGGGPLKNTLLKRLVVKIMNKAKLIIVRDDYTKKFFECNSVTNKIITTTDTALVIKNYKLPKISNKEFLNFIAKNKNKKIVLVHLYGNYDIDFLIKERIITAINSFSRLNECAFIFAGDYVFNKKYDVSNIFDSLESDNKIFYQYSNPWEFCSVINTCDMVITTKLHVGIIASTLSKSVLSFPMHFDKTKRFYEQISEKERCVELSKVSTSKVLSLLNSYFEKDIHISDELFLRANKNLDFLLEELENLSKEDGKYES